MCGLLIVVLCLIVTFLVMAVNQKYLEVFEAPDLSDQSDQRAKGVRNYKSTVYLCRHASMLLAGIQLRIWIPA